MSTEQYLYIVHEGNNPSFELIGKGQRSVLNKLMLVHHDENFPGEKIYYTKRWVDEEGLEWVDFGSWSSFYVFSDKEK